MKPMFNLPAWSIRHPYSIITAYAAVVLLCLLAVIHWMPHRMMPYVPSPLIGIVTEAPGMAPEDIETYFSKPIEEKMVHLPHVRYIRSTSQEGFSMVSLEFPYGIDMSKALLEVQALMRVVQGELPGLGANGKPSWVVSIDPLNIPVLTMALRAPGWNAVALREFAENTVINHLKMLPDIQSVFAYGGQKRQLQITLDREKLATFGLSITAVKTILDQTNLGLSAGRLTQGSHESILRLDTKLGALDVLKKIPLKADQDRMVYLQDVAEIQDAHREQRSGYHVIQAGIVREDSVAIHVVQNPGSSSPRVIQAIQTELKYLEAQYPGLSFSIAYDNSYFVGILMENMVGELLLALLLTALAVFFFLHGNWRATGITLISLPVSLALAIVLMVPLGMSLNSSTLIGLLVVIGRLVDDAIIDIHAIQKHLRLGKSVSEATVAGISEVRLAVAASSLVLMAGLSPLLFCGGIVQLMFVGLVWPIILGIGASFLVSMTLTAVLANAFLQPEPEKPSKSWIYRFLVHPFDRGLNWLEQRYAQLIDWLLHHRLTNLVRILCTLMIGFGFYFFIGGEMMPLADVGQAYGVLETQPGTSYERTLQITRAIEKLMAEYPEIATVSTEIGTEPGGTYFTGYAMNRVNGATFMLTLTDKGSRQRSIWEIMDTLQQRAVQTIPGIRRLQIKEMGSDVMASSQAPISLLITGKDLNMVDQLTRQVADLARHSKGLYQVGTAWTMGVPTIRLQPDLVRLQEMGLTVKELGEQLDYSLRGGLTEEDYYRPNVRQNTIQLRLPPSQHKALQDLELVPITNAAGATVPLKTLTTLSRTIGPTLIEHEGLRRSNTVLAYYRLNDKPSMDATMDLMMKAMGQLNWPQGYTLEMRGDMTQMMDSFSRLFQGLLLSLLLIFLILVAQFKGIIQPLQMIFSLPLELTGVFMALFLAHQAFSSVSILAVIVLTGMDMTTAILLIDQILRYRQQGFNRDEAVKRACPERLRPILMTSGITILVMARIAVAPPTGLDAYSPLATVVIGGLLAGTLLSLWDIPLMHTLIDDLVLWGKRRIKS